MARQSATRLPVCLTSSDFSRFCLAATPTPIVGGRTLVHVSREFFTDEELRAIRKVRYWIRFQLNDNLLQQSQAPTLSIGDFTDRVPEAQKSE